MSAGSLKDDSRPDGAGFNGSPVISQQASCFRGKLVMWEAGSVKFSHGMRHAMEGRSIFADLEGSPTVSSFLKFILAFPKQDTSFSRLTFPEKKN